MKWETPIVHFDNVAVILYTKFDYHYFLVIFVYLLTKMLLLPDDLNYISLPCYCCHDRLLPIWFAWSDIYVMVWIKPKTKTLQSWLSISFESTLSYTILSHSPIFPCVTAQLPNDLASTRPPRPMWKTKCNNPSPDGNFPQKTLGAGRYPVPNNVKRQMYYSFLKRGCIYIDILSKHTYYHSIIYNDN